MPSEAAMSKLIVNEEGWKCAEHNTDDFDALKFGRCLRTKRTHSALLASLMSGKECTEIPSVNWLFVQLTWPGPPATQNFPPPERRRFASDALAMFTSNQSNTTTLHMSYL